MRLYPSTLKTLSRLNGSQETYTSRRKFRAVTQPQLPPGTPVDPCLGTWANVDGVTYGERGLDDWGFELDPAGKATRLTIRMLRLKMQKT